MASFRYENVYIKDAYSIAGPYEKKGKIENYNLTIDDLAYGEKTFEQAEIKLQVKAIDSLMAKNYLNDCQVNLLIGGDLSNQLTTSCVTASKYKIPFIGVYSACASFNESVIIAANYLQNSLKKIIAFTSSHNLNSEKQFRYPIEYGAPKKECTTFTATGAVATLLTTEITNIKIESATIGRVVDYGIKDANNMGAVMAPAAYHVLLDHLYELNRNINYYDLILTGDLGKVGMQLFHALLSKQHLKAKKHLDAGMEIFTKNQDVKSGSSGPVTLPLVLFNKIIPEKKYHKILLIATGSLHSPSLVNQKNSLPSIAHAISLEVNNDLS